MNQPATDRSKSSALPPAVATRLAKAFGSAANGHHAARSGFHLLHENLSALAGRAVLIDESAVSVDLQYYIYRDDTSGRILTQKLLDAADRGVRIRLLADDLGTRLNNPWITALDSHPAIEVRIFNPIGGHSGVRRRLDQLLSFGRINHRMHNKLFIADGIAMITGGRNLADGYFTSADIEFIDVDALAIGAVVSDATKTFDEYWNSALAVSVCNLITTEGATHTLPELRAHLRRKNREEQDSEFFRAVEESALASDLAAGKVPFHWGPATLYADPPAKAIDRESLPVSEFPGYRLKQVVQKTQKRLQISNAYLIPGEPGMHLFTELRERGVQVDALTNGLSSTDTALAHGAYSRYRKPLLRAGVRLWELQANAVREHRMRWFSGSTQSTLHAKTFVLDSGRGFVGSINLDSRSMILNTEIGVLIENDEINEQLHQLFREWTAPSMAWRVELDEAGQLTWRGEDEGGNTLEEHKDPDSTTWQRFLTWVLSKLPVESQI
ncbi:Phosphatidylserine/phosphatidylglycerophosphate/cardiolipin synthase [Microbulbifer donghaiensis]|uniref:Phosphatidylserine/phosphatidylglycerophosphate/cardiolipin synthase n=1 Tax=Microbulbifer donghaiensis TaxID=494016 RepID=A0A1M4VTI8_9GAMM|nr:phospholipase D family protein [Microbulbifer donghaiensis]SHE72177.1 Phosphatidylserine/phosphatidylglycerophosphate/cardiolipin synthase [Microbulbifer donghaiensis]